MSFLGPFAGMPRLDVKPHERLLLNVVRELAFEGGLESVHWAKRLARDSDRNRPVGFLGTGEIGARLLRRRKRRRRKRSRRRRRRKARTGLVSGVSLAPETFSKQVASPLNSLNAKHISTRHVGQDAQCFLEALNMRRVRVCRAARTCLTGALIWQACVQLCPDALERVC